MKFNEVIEALVEGQYAARKVWDHTGEYVVLLPGMQYAWKILIQPNPNAGNWLPLIEDIQAEDWNIVKSDRKPVPLEVVSEESNVDQVNAA